MFGFQDIRTITIRTNAKRYMYGFKTILFGNKIYKCLWWYETGHLRFASYSLFWFNVTSFYFIYVIKLFIVTRDTHTSHTLSFGLMLRHVSSTQLNAIYSYIRYILAYFLYRRRYKEDPIMWAQGWRSDWVWCTAGYRRGCPTGFGIAVYTGSQDCSFSTVSWR